jgi:hypothetical protein
VNSSAPSRPTPRRFAASASTTTPAVEAPGWSRFGVTHGAVAVDVRTFQLADGVAVTVARFRSHETRFALHVGSNDPATGGRALPRNAGPAVTGPERGVLACCLQRRL